MRGILITALALLGGTAAAAPSADLASLGKRLFHDSRFSSPKGDLQTACSSCHMEEDVQGDRAFTEMLSRSWHPFRSEDPGRETLRNSPTLFDVGQMKLIHHDGQFISLEEQTRETFLGRNMGWLTTERQDALRHLKAVLSKDAGYRRDFQTAVHIDTESATPEILVVAMAQAVAAFMRTLVSGHDTPYDDFVTANELDPGPREGETAERYGERVLWELIEKQNAGALDLPADFSEAALTGYKVFLRTSGARQAGNCVSCHVPPAFTDFEFHNTGVAQEEYERVHGEGSFARLILPGAAEANRPLPRLMARIQPDAPEKADLGLWNFLGAADPGTSPTQEALDRALGAFKTPTLRHLASTGPYMHNGEYAVIESALLQKARAGQLVREGQMRNPSPALGAIRFSEGDLEALFAFLNTLNERGRRLAWPTPIRADEGLMAPGAQPYRGY